MFFWYQMFLCTDCQDGSGGDLAPAAGPALGQSWGFGVQVSSTVEVTHTGQVYDDKDYW